MATAVSKGGGHRGYQGSRSGREHLRRLPQGHSARRGSSWPCNPFCHGGLPPPPTTLPSSLTGRHGSPRSFTFRSQKPLLLASAPARAQPHQPPGARAARLAAPSGIALSDFSSAAAVAAAAMVARAAQNANYRLGSATGGVGGAEARGRGLYARGRSQSGRVRLTGAGPRKGPRKPRTGHSGTTDSAPCSRDCGS